MKFKPGDRVRHKYDDVVGTVKEPLPATSLFSHHEQFLVELDERDAYGRQTYNFRGEVLEKVEEN